MVASDVAARIARLTEEEILPRTGGRIEKSIGDPSMWAKDGHSGESYAETFRNGGVWMIQADNDRVLGWGRLRHWLRPHPAGGRWLMFHPDCVYAIRTYPGLVHSKADPDDVDTAGEDHAADADRYGVMARPTPTIFRSSQPVGLPTDIQQLLSEARGPGPRPAGKVA